MRTARNYLAKEIYRSSAVVLVALLGLFSFFTLVDELDSVSDRFPISALLSLELLAMPTRLYDLLPIGLLIGSILALAGLAQRNELVILRISGMSGMRILRMLWVISIPVVILAILLSEVIAPAAEIRYSEANLLMRGRVEGGRMVSGYWFKESTANGGTRIINVGKLLSSGEVAELKVYEFPDNTHMSSMWSAPSATFSDNKLLLKDVTENRFAADAQLGLIDGKPAQEPLMVVLRSPEVEISTTLTPARLVSRILTPERMTWLMLSDYIDYLERNKLDADRQIVAIWRKVAYPFTLIVMLTIAAPISYMQTRRGGVGAKIFIGILMGTGFFMLNQLALNVGLLYGWPPLVTALLPNSLAMAIALGTIYAMENRLKWSGRKLQSSIKASA